MNATRWIPLVLALPLAAPAQTGFVAVGRSHLRSGFALRVAGTVGDQNTQAGACDVAAFHCIGPGPLTYSWLISAGYGLGVVGAIPAGPVSVRVEARQYWLAIPTVSNFALVDFGLARRY
jgi:hypothetical protein